MRVIQPEIDEAGGGLVFPQEAKRLVHHPPGALVAGHLARFQLVLRTPWGVFQAQGRGRLRAFIGAQPQVVAVGGEFWGVGHIPPAAQMPLAHMGGFVTRFLQHSGQRGCLGIEIVRHLAGPVACFCLQVAVDAPAGWKLPRDQAATGRGTDGRRHISPRESHPFTRHLVHPWRGDHRVALAGKVAPAEIIHQHDHHIGAPWAYW